MNEEGCARAHNRQMTHHMKATLWKQNWMKGAAGLVVAVAFFACPTFGTASIAAPRLAAFAPVPVVAELFTSEGCSSCPPADALLSRLLVDQPVEGVEVIAISEHVDYWNGLGWKDPFSSPRFSERQREYARARNASQIYTPQLVVDGRLAVVGSDRTAVRQSLLEAARRPRASVAVSAVRSDDGRSASVRVLVRNLRSTLQKGTIRVLVATVEDNVVSDVTRGENANRRLRHDAVARALDTIGAFEDGAEAGEFTKEIALEGGWAGRRLRVVAFLQDDRTRHILGAAASNLN